MAFTDLHHHVPDTEGNDDDARDTTHSQAMATPPFFPFMIFYVLSPLIFRSIQVMTIGRLSSWCQLEDAARRACHSLQPGATCTSDFRPDEVQQLRTSHVQ